MYKKFPGKLLNHFESKRCIKKRFFERIINFEIIKISKSKEKKAQNNTPPRIFCGKTNNFRGVIILLLEVNYKPSP